MKEAEIIKTLKAPCESLYKEKGSEFFARAFPVKTESEAEEILETLRKKYYDASHHCYAFRLKNGVFRYSDAGEPSGSAGIRIINAIDHFILLDILVVVTRYFGGTKLGMGPLGKAYYFSSEQLLGNCAYQEEKPFRRITIIIDFTFISLVHRVITNNSAIIENTLYGDDVKFICLIPEDNINRIEKELVDSSSGKIIVNFEPGYIYHTI